VDEKGGRASHHPPPHLTQPLSSLRYRITGCVRRVR
jgi:hypothetical protein